MKQSFNKKIVSVTQTSEFWIALLFLAGTMFFFAQVSRQPRLSSLETKEQVVVTPTPTAVPLIRTQQPSEVGQNAGVTVTVKVGDTFWKLAQRYCGSHQYAQSIAAQNGYTNVRRLRDGAHLRIVCGLK